MIFSIFTISLNAPWMKIAASHACNNPKCSAFHIDKIILLDLSLVKAINDALLSSSAMDIISQTCDDPSSLKLKDLAEKTINSTASSSRFSFSGFALELQLFSFRTLAILLQECHTRVQQRCNLMLLCSYSRTKWHQHSVRLRIIWWLFGYILGPMWPLVLRVRITGWKVAIMIGYNCKLWSSFDNDSSREIGTLDVLFNSVFGPYLEV